MSYDDELLEQGQGSLCLASGVEELEQENAELEQENERLKKKLKSIANAAAECLDEREEELGLRRRC